jgi:hypothetical protein
MRWRSSLAALLMRMSMPPPSRSSSRAMLAWSAAMSVRSQRPNSGGWAAFAGKPLDQR